LASASHTFCPLTVPSPIDYLSAELSSIKFSLFSITY
jgi:hypothetical protein